MHGGSLGYFPSSSIVAVQADPYSAKFLTDVETAEKLFEARGPTYFGGTRRRHTKLHRRSLFHRTRNHRTRRQRRVSGKK